MAKEYKLESSTLNWVKKELDALLHQTRQALETYIEEGTNPSELEQVKSLLQQVRGTLQMVELYGAARLADEMETLTQALCNDEVKSKDDVFEVLLRATLQLPDYLEHIQTGNRDIPIVLLPLINDLRAARGAELLSEKVLFFPELESAQVPERASATQDPSPQDLQTLAKKLRHNFQLGLLGWFREQEVAASLKRLSEVTDQLYQAAQAQPSRRLWWIASAVTEALAHGGLESGVAAKSLLGRMDREIKRLIDHGEVEFAAAIPAELIKNLLYYVACAQDEGERVAEVKRAFALRDLMPRGADLDEMRHQITGPNLELLATVAKAIAEDLAEVKDVLELFVTDEDKAGAKLEALADKLQKISDTLAMVGLVEAQQKVLAQAELVGHMVAGEQDASEAAILNIAGVMLDVESAVEHFISGRATLDAQAQHHPVYAEFSSPYGLSAADHRKLVDTVLSEALQEMEKTKEAVLGYISAPEERASVQRVPDHLSAIKGALDVIGVEAVLPILNAIEHYVGSRLLVRQGVPETQELETLADAITSVECYLESLSTGEHDLTAVLATGNESIAKLALAADSDETGECAGHPGGEDSGRAADLDTLTEADETEIFRLDDTLAEGAQDTGVMEPLGESSPELESKDDPEALTLAVGDNEHEAPEISAETAPKADNKTSTAHPDLAVLTGEADAEILDIFIEEAEEETNNIQQRLPQWLHNRGDEEALTAVRRSFHTLKGSGRLVGAQVLGEFAWAVEDLMNRIIDQTVELGEPHLELLSEVTAALPQLVAQVKGAGEPQADVFALMERAQGLSKPGGFAISEAQKKKLSEQGQTSVAQAQDRQQTEPQTAPCEGEPLAAHGLDEAQGNESADESATAIFDNLESPLESFPLPEVEELQESEPQATLSDGEPLATEDGSNEGQAHRRVGEAASAVANDAEPALAPSPIPDSQLGKESEPEQDPELLAIFAEEAREHLTALDRLLKASEDPQSDLLPNTELLRTLHTLNGSARTADIQSIASLCGALEKYSHSQETASRPIPKAVIPLFRRVHDTVAQRVEALADPAAGAPTDDQLQAEIDALLTEPHTEQEPIPALEAEASSDDDESTQGNDGEPHAGDVAAASPEQDGELEADNPADQDPDLVEIFLEEAADILDASDEALRAWGEDLDGKETVKELQRQLHTLKGGARMAGYHRSIGDLSHALESLIIAVVDDRVSASSPLFDTLHLSLDRLNEMVETAGQSKPVYPAPSLIATLERLRQGEAIDPNAVASAAHQAETAVTGESPESEEEIPASNTGASGPVSGQAAPAARGGEAQNIKPNLVKVAAAGDAPTGVVRSDANKGAASHEVIRVRSDLLDKLVNCAGEVNIYHARLEQQISSFRFNLSELDQTVARLRDQLRKLEMETEAQILYNYDQLKDELDEDFDPLELDRYSTIQQLSRSLGESLSDLLSIREILVDQVRDSETLLLQQSRVSTDLQEGLMRTRMVQFTGLAHRLRRIARQTATELGKRVEVHFHGESNELDRSVLDRMVAPLEHMLRNAISHGIETPEQRHANAKPEVGSVQIGVAREGSEVVIRAEDDGAGIDLEAVRRKAVRLGLVGDDDKPSDQDVMQFILESGFSTAQQVTQIAGRGVGMDVVNSEIRQLGGVLSIESTQGKGTTFTIRLPFTLAISQALLVQAGEDLYAVALASIEGIVRLSAEQLKASYAQQNPVYEYAGNAYELKHLGSLLGKSKPALSESLTVYPVLLVRSGDQRVAVQVEGLVGNREIVVKPVGPQISRVRGISGATILGDGRVVLILDMAALVRRGTGVRVVYSATNATAEKDQSRLPTIMVVDDSITIRKVTSRMLERHKFAVLTAKDGVDAVGQLQETAPDLMLLDIEMPRMDGYELATHVRNDSRLKDLPIIMITSRSGKKHRQRALEIGVDRYLGKPYQEGDLLQNINEVLAEAQRKAS